MSRVSHQRYLERMARQAASRAKTRAPDKRLTAAAARTLKIQTVEPWKRWVAVGAGLLIAWGGSLAVDHGFLWVGIGLILFALVVVLVGALGRKRAIESVLDGIDLGDVLEGIVDAIDI